MLRNLVVREGRRTGPDSDPPRHLAGRASPPPVDLHTIVAEGSGDSERTHRRARARSTSKEELCGLRFRISPSAFFQTNTEMAERLYAIAAEKAGLTGSERVFDLFCGIGTLGLTLAAAAGEVWGVEIVPEAIADAEGNARLNGIDNARFRAGDARKEIRPCWSRRPASPTSSWSTRPAPASPRRWCAG